MALLVWGLPAGPSLAQIVAADDFEAIRAHALDLVNQSRQEHDLPPLVLEDKLNASAQAHADDMYKRRYHDHNSPEGNTAHDRYIEAGGSKWRQVAENIAHCTGCRPPPRVSIAERLHRGWMQSPGHRENILRKGLTHFGYGMVADEQKELYAAQTFAGPGLPRGLREDEPPTPLSAEEQAQRALERINLARQESGAVRLQLSPELNRAAQTILPAHDLEDFDLESRQHLLSSSARQQWRSLFVLSANCGGCGAVPTAADVRYFAQDWLDDPSYKKDLLDPRVTHIGFAIAANGEGMKVALAVLGLGR